jgi:hypothetical protein
MHTITYVYGRQLRRTYWDVAAIRHWGMKAALTGFDHPSLLG